MVNKFTAKIFIGILLILISAAWVYVWHYVPMNELKEKRDEVKILKIEKKTENFESRFGAIKETINQKKEDPHEEINLTIGFHTTIFD